MSDTFTLLDVRSSIIRTMQGHHNHTNTAILERLEKQPQNRGNENQKTDRIPTVYDRAFQQMNRQGDYYDGRPGRGRSLFFVPAGTRSGREINYQHVRIPISVFQADTKPNYHPIIEMMPFLVYYSYATKYHNPASMNIHGYQCSNVYIDVEKGALMNKCIQ